MVARYLSLINIVFTTYFVSNSIQSIVEVNICNCALLHWTQLVDKSNKTEEIKTIL